MRNIFNSDDISSLKQIKRILRGRDFQTFPNSATLELNKRIETFADNRREKFFVYIRNIIC
mgnify:CR=1 FL=1